MKTITVKYSGFCPGIRKAEKRIDDLRAKNERPVVVLGDLINNKEYIRYLESRGVKTVDTVDEAPEGSLVAIRAAGIDRRLESELRSRRDVVDLTCAIVKDLQTRIEALSRQGYFIVITGKRRHPEVLGLVSYAQDYYVVESEGDLPGLFALLDGKDETAFKLAVLSQTTAERSLFEGTARTLNERYRGRFGIAVFDTICPVTTKREERAILAQKDADVSFVVGDRISSNAGKLFKRLADNGGEVYFVSNLEELTKLGLDMRRYKTALVVSSSSTPDFIERGIVDYLESLER